MVSTTAMTRLCFAVATLCGAWFVPSVQAQRQLEWKFATGQQMTVQFVQSTETETKVNSRPIKMSVETRLQMEWTVGKVDEQGVAELTLAYKRLQLHIGSGDKQAIRYDSVVAEQPSEAGREIAESVGPLMGTKMVLKMNPRGEILDVQPTEDAKAALQQATRRSGWQEQFSKQGILRTLGQAAVVLPEVAVEPGATWSQNREVDAPLGRIKLTSEYTYQGSEDRDGKTLEKIDVATQVSFVTPPVGGLKLKGQEQQGTLFFDARAGRLAESRVTQELRTERLYRDQKIEVQTNSTTTLQVN